jgi:hypothetical protein
MLQQVLEQARGLEKVAAVAERGVREPFRAGPGMRRTVCSERGIFAAVREGCSSAISTGALTVADIPAAW